MITYAELYERLPGVEANGSADHIPFTCLLCGHAGAYVRIDRRRRVFCNCPKCFKTAELAEALALAGETIGEEDPAPLAEDLKAHPPEPEPESQRGPGEDREEDEFQTDLKRWKGMMFRMGETLLERDQRLRVLEGEPLFNELLEALLPLPVNLRGYEVPSQLEPEYIRPEIESIARLLVSLERPVKSKAKTTEPPPVEVLELSQLYHLIDEWDRQPWVWDGILPHRSLSLIVGKSETGKSTLIYSLIYAIVSGQEFFKRQCEEGRVIYLAGDPVSEIVAGKTFRALGIQEGITVLAGALVAHPQGIQLLRGTMQRVKPILVVADTLAATVPIDTDKYGQSYQTQQPLSKLAREFGPNLLMSHHSQKSAMEAYNVIDCALGSVGVAAVASSRMATRKYKRQNKEFYTFEMSNLRLGQPIEGEWIVHKMDDGQVELVDLWKTRNIELDKELILQVLTKRGEPLTKRTIWYEMRPKPKYGPYCDALEALLDGGLLERHASGKRGGGDIFGPPSFFRSI